MKPSRIGVITPVGGDSTRLDKALASVASQTLPPSLHVVIHDGNLPENSDPRAQHVVLPFACEDTGATPRAVGANIALAQHCDALAFLDADNVWAPHHLESLVAAAARCDIAVAKRRICDDHGEPLYVDEFDSDGKQFCDTNCFLLTGKAISVARMWGNVPRVDGVRTAGVDRVFWDRVRHQRFVIGHTGQVTVDYRSRWLAHYAGHDERKPDRCKVLEFVDGVPRATWVDVNR